MKWLLLLAPAGLAVACLGDVASPDPDGGTGGSSDESLGGRNSGGTGGQLGTGSAVGTGGLGGQLGTGSAAGTGGLGGQVGTGSAVGTGGLGGQVGTGSAAGTGGMGGWGEPGSSLEPFDCDAAPPGTCEFGDDFVMRWVVWWPEYSVELPLVQAGAYDFMVDWGDGTTGHVTSHADPDARHEYPDGESMIYFVRISGLLEGWSWGESYMQFPEHEILHWGTLSLGATTHQFESIDANGAAYPNLIFSATDAPDLSKTQSLEAAFRGATISGDLTPWDVSGVTSLASAFSWTYCSADISTWDVSGVTDMFGTFEGEPHQYDPVSYHAESPFTCDISAWDVSSVTNMRLIFHRRTPTADISNWDVSNVTDMSGAFASSDFAGDISAWDVSKVTNMSATFRGSMPDDGDWGGFSGNISGWDVSSVTNMSRMFEDNVYFYSAGDLSSWDVSNVTDMSDMFRRSGISTAEYDALLVGWGALPALQGGVPFYSSARYSAGAPAAARAHLIDEFGWIITDAGQAP